MALWALTTLPGTILPLWVYELSGSSCTPESGCSYNPLRRNRETGAQTEHLAQGTEPATAVARTHPHCGAYYGLGYESSSPTGRLKGLQRRT